MGCRDPQHSVAAFLIGFHKDPRMDVDHGGCPASELPSYVCVNAGERQQMLGAYASSDFKLPAPVACCLRAFSGPQSPLCKCRMQEEQDRYTAPPTQQPSANDCLGMMDKHPTSLPVSDIALRCMVYTVSQQGYALVAHRGNLLDNTPFITSFSPHLTFPLPSSVSLDHLPN